MPPPPSGSQPPGRHGTLVGGLPWLQPQAEPGSRFEPGQQFEPGPQVDPGMPFIETAAPGGPSGKADASEPPQELSWPERLDAWVRQSPPFSVSVSAHVLALLLLALVVARREAPKRISLDLSFASEMVEDVAEDQGVQIVAPEEPEAEPEPEVVETEKPPAEDPVAAPVMVDEIADTGGGATAEPVPQHVPIGSLLDGRQEGRRAALVLAFGGSDVTEAAVAKALAWLAKQQQRDGLWSLMGPYADRGSQENRLAATAMALLAFQGAGNTPSEGRYKAVVARAWKALTKQQLPDGQFDLPLPSHHTLYSHAQATFAACELYGMTKDAAFAEPARLALAYALAAQAPDGGWRYAPREPGDMSVTGWFLMSLKSAEMAGLAVPPAAFEQMRNFVDGVSLQGGSRYGYRVDSPLKPPTGMTPAVSAEGLLARQFLGWRRQDPRLTAGLELLLGEKFLDFENDKDVYAWYYITQVAHNVGGSAWDRWNGRMREILPKQQSAEGPEAGSWDPANDKWGHIGGRLFTTCFCTWMLEVYYRHLPLYEAVAE
ncbi:MAG: squalene--hopene cyclase [Planctomycetota bacterium]